MQLKYKSRQEVLKYYLSERGKWIDQPLNSTRDYTLVRIASLMRVVTPEYTKRFNTEFSKLSQDNKNLILEEFYPLTERKDRTATYIPATLLNLLSNKDISKKEKNRIKFVFKEGLPFIATVLHEFRHDQANIPYDKNITLNFNEIAKIAKEDPMKLKTRDYTILKSGIVTIPNERI